MKLGHIIIYVADVPATVEFYERAFGLKRRFVHESNQYAEVETGNTSLSFASYAEAEANNIAILRNNKEGPAPAWEICFLTDSVQSAFERALANGCRPICSPIQKPWGQTVSYVRDLNGCLVEISSPVGG
jgi:lactoylglutathione lyase